MPHWLYVPAGVGVLGFYLLATALLVSGWIDSLRDANPLLVPFGIVVVGYTLAGLFDRAKGQGESWVAIALAWASWGGVFVWALLYATASHAQTIEPRRPVAGVFAFAVIPTDEHAEICLALYAPDTAIPTNEFGDVDVQALNQAELVVECKSATDRQDFTHPLTGAVAEDVVAFEVPLPRSRQGWVVYAYGTRQEEASLPSTDRAELYFGLRAPRLLLEDSELWTIPVR